jgi:hypothetical protein
LPPTWQLNLVFKDLGDPLREVPASEDSKAPNRGVARKKDLPFSSIWMRPYALREWCGDS